MNYRLLLIIPILFLFHGCATYEAWQSQYPPHCHMRAGSAGLAAESLHEGMAASGNVYADCQEEMYKQNN